MTSPSPSTGHVSTRSVEGVAQGESLTDTLILVCQRVLEANRHKLDGDRTIRGIDLNIKLSSSNQHPHTALFNLRQETSLHDLLLQPEKYSFLT